MNKKPKVKKLTPAEKTLNRCRGKDSKEVTIEADDVSAGAELVAERKTKGKPRDIWAAPLTGSSPYKVKLQIRLGGKPCGNAQGHQPDKRGTEMISFTIMNPDESDPVSDPVDFMDFTVVEAP